VCACLQASAYADHGEAGPWRFHWTETRRAWGEEFKGEVEEGSREGRGWW
jgi:hypothetical protein